MRSNADEDDPLVQYRTRLLYVLSIATAIFISPFTVTSFLQGRFAVGFLSALTTAGLVVDAVAIHRGRKPPIPVAAAFALIAPAIAISSWSAGIGPMLWSYPLILLLYFALRLRYANILTAMLIAGLTPIAYRSGDLGLTTRLAATLTLTAVMGNLLLRLIGELYAKLRDQAISDPLTGVFNRRHLDPSLDEAIERSRRSGAPVSLIVTDIDHFKQINDRYGHPAGDAVLKGVAVLLIRRKRRLDLVFRIGGEEFVLLLPDAREDDAVRLAEELRTSISTAPLLHGWKVTASFGVSGLRPSDSADPWLKSADDALYLAKRNGRNLVVRRDQAEGSPAPLAARMRP
jgi:diguanylate cyclase (GGDEF)-like protein